MGAALTLDVAAWAAIISDNATAELGAAEPVTAIPAAHRRRMPLFVRDALRCALPLLRERPNCPVILTSPHGDLISTVALLTDIAQRQILSPSLFGLSVHNAPLGALSLCLEAPGDQTALAGDAASLAAGFTEAYVRLVTSEASSVVLCHAEEPLPPCYAEFDYAAPGVFLAMVLTLSDERAREVTEVAEGRDGAAAIARALASGASRIMGAPPQLHGLAA